MWWSSLRRCGGLARRCGGLVKGGVVSFPASKPPVSGSNLGPVWGIEGRQIAMYCNAAQIMYIHNKTLGLGGL